MLYIPFNVNDVVRIKLNDHGRKIVKNYELDATMTGIIAKPVIKFKEVQDGWAEWPLWQIMHVFGEHLCEGCEMPFNPQLEFMSDQRSEPRK